MRTSRRLGTLAAAAALAATTAGAPPAHAYFDEGNGQRVPVYVTHTPVSAPAPDKTGDSSLIAVGGAAILVLTAGVAMRSRARARA